MKLKKLIYLAIALGMYSTQASAVNWVSPSSYGSVAVVGGDVLTKTAAHSEGENVPLSNALRLIVPGNWVLITKELPKIHVSWNADSWVDTLKLLAKTFGVDFVIDITKHQVVATYASSAKSSVSVVSAKYQTPDNEEKTDYTEVSLANAKTNEVTKPIAWTLTTGNTIKKDLETWASTAGWKVVWSLSKDWTVPATTTFTGTFQAATTDVIKTLASNGALIQARFYGNNTVVITGASE